jgi:hypothetical protein
VIEPTIVKLRKATIKTTMHHNARCKQLTTMPNPATMSIPMLLVMLAAIFSGFISRL